MGKGGKRGKRESRPLEVDVESDEEMYDEIDAFHKQDRAIGKGKIKVAHGKKVEEVLNVEGDTSEEDEEKDDKLSDFGTDEEEDDDPEARLPSKEQWGKRKRDFYSSGYVDNDYGGVGSSDEEELARLEEIDAIARQKELDAAAAVAVHADDVWEEQEKEEGEESVKGKKKEESEEKAKVVEGEWKASTVKAHNEQLLDAIDELNRVRLVKGAIIEPLSELVALLPQGSATRKRLLLVTDIYTSYLLNLLFFVRLKTDSIATKKSRDATVDEHPVVAQLHKLKKMESRADDYLQSNLAKLMRLKERLEAGEELTAILPADMQPLKASKRAALDAEDAEALADAEGMEEEGEEGGKRGIPYAIEKNKAMKGKKKKGPGHSRAQKRKQFEKALVKRRSQVPDVRREDKRYEGEARGIRASTVKSTKLIA